MSKTLKVALFASFLIAAGGPVSRVEAGCASPGNAIEAENCLPGTPTAVWDLPQPNAGEPTLQGFATEISVNKGETIRFKIKSTSSTYTIDIYRVGYYNGTGARKVASVTPVAYPQPQPGCYSDATGILDCGNWAESASWAVPATAVSGTYLARLTRTDTGGASHIIFIVRDDSSHADILFQNSDSTWQAYNAYGGYSLYQGPNSAGRAFKLSYNRPFTTRLDGSSYFFTHEYPMIRWLEANGYDVTYFTCVDTTRRGHLILNHKSYFSVGHDEYWSSEMRSAVEAAQNAGVHTAFFSANEIYWKIRWETSFDGTNTPYRTLVSYKESYEDAPLDPMNPPTWTGTWEDPRFSPPADGNRPQNALTGQLYRVNTYRQDAIQVSSEDGKMRFWRNSAAASLAPGASLSFPETLGYEWDEDADNGFRPAGIIHLSSSTYFVQDYKKQAAGSVYGPAWATHNLTLFKKPSGAIVFGAGTMQWTWGIDVGHDHGSHFAAATPLRQATVNLLADMGIQPKSLQSGLTAVTASSDTVAPNATITYPVNGQGIALNSTMTVTGTAGDIGGRVGAVEISLDNGSTWHPVTGGRSTWTYTWVPNFSGSATLKARAVDDSLNIGAPSNPVTVGSINSAPTLSGISPASALPGSAALTLTLTGSGYTNASVVRWNGSDRATTFVNSTTLQAAIPASDIAIEGSASVTVFNPAPGGGLSLRQTFVIGISCPCSIWDSSVVPANATNDANSIEVGVKFRTDVAGTIQGIRFYKNAFNTRPHTGHLWSRTGTLLASVTFSSETATGWQQANFSTPVTVSSNTTYVASYFTTSGYGVNRNYFTSAATDKAPLHALKSGVDGVNAVFKYAAAPAFPTDSYIDSNYWVDVVFVPVGNPVPVLNSITPASAVVGRTTFTMTVNGANFVSNSSVRWNGSARPTVFVDSGTLKATVFESDLTSTGTASVVVFNPNPSGGVSEAQIFTIFVAPPAPVLDSISPSTATAGSPGFTMTVRGSNFIPTSIFQWNGGDRATTFVSSMTLTVSIPAGDLVSSGTIPVEVLTASGSASAFLFFTVLPPGNPVPSIASLTPASVPAGTSGLTLTVNGGGFISSSTVQWNGEPRATVFVSSLQLTAFIPGSDLASTGVSTVTVVNPNPGGGVSNPQNVTITPDVVTPNPVPGLTAVSPSSNTAGGPEFTLGVTGTNFISSSAVQWNGSSRSTVYISSSQLSVRISSADITAVGVATVTVFNPAPGGGASSGLSFNIYSSTSGGSSGTGNPVPVISSVTPTGAVVGRSTLTVIVNGTGFVPGAVVRWNGSSRPTTYVSSTTVQAVLPPADFAVSGNAALSVFNPAPGGGVSNAVGFIVGPANPVPVLSSTNPTNLKVGDPGFTLSVTGTGFIPASIVTWGGSERPTTFINSTSLTAAIPASDLTTRSFIFVRVTNPAPGGGTSGTKTFTIRLQPTLTSLSPTAVNPGGPAFSLAVTGINIATDTVVRWNGLDRATQFVSTTQATASILASDIVSTGTFPITLSNLAPGGISNSVNFSVTASTVNPIPVLNVIAPSSATAGGAAFTMAIFGTNFANGAVVKWNGSARTTVFVNPTRLNASVITADLAVPGTSSVTVTNPAPGGGVSNGLLFTVSPASGPANPVPTLTTLVPSSATAGGPAFTLGLTGTGFVSSSTVQWNGGARPTVFITSTQLSASISASDIASVNVATITVFNPAPGGGISNPRYLTVQAAPVTPNPVPAILSATPSSATAGDPGFTLVINGSGFISSSTVQWNGADRTAVYISSTQLNASIPASDITASGTATLTVRNPLPGGGLSNGFSFTISSAPVVLNPVPVLATVTPSSATAGDSGLTLTVAGSNFISSSTLQWNGSDRLTVYISSTQLNASVLASDLTAAGTAALTVRNPAPGGGVSNSFSFMIGAAAPEPNPSPSITTLTPNSAAAGSPGFTLMVTGGPFVSSSTVLWNGSARDTLFISSMQLNAAVTYIDLALPGVSSVTVVTPAPGGGLSNAAYFTVTETPPSPNPVPSLTNVTPSSATAGDPGFTLTVTGTNFVSSSTVQWNGSARGTVFISGSQLAASIASSDIASVGLSTITVFNPAPGGGLSNALTVSVGSVTAPGNPVPAISSATPSGAVVGRSTLTVIVNGSGYIASSIVRFNGTNRPTTYINGTTLQTVLPPADFVVSGTFNLTVSNPGPGGGVSNAVPFVVGPANPVPALTSISPTTFKIGDPGFTLSVLGTGFLPSSIVTWNGFNRPTTFINSGSLTAAIPASDLSTRAFIFVRVVNPAPGGGTSGTKTFTIRLQPSLTSLSPMGAAPGGPAFTLTVNGVNIATDTVVRWNGADRATQYVSSTQVTASILSSDIASPGTASVTAFNLAPGGVSNGLNFAINSSAHTLSFGLITPQAPASTSDFSQIRVYPNPWRMDRHSAKQVSFDQMPVGTTVKLFTISGHWVKTLDGSSGTALWNLSNDSGQPVASGYYVYVATTEAGQRQRGVIGVIR